MGAEREEDVLTKTPLRRPGWPGIAVAALATALTGALSACVAPDAPLPTMPPAPRQAHCAPQAGLAFLCGTGAAEEVVPVPGTPWLVSSALNIGAPATLHLIDRATGTVRPLAARIAPDPALTPDCPGPPDFTRWSTDGLAARQDADGRLQLYAANHGDRQAIELLTLERTSRGAVLTWTGCAIMPAGTRPNAVAIDGDGIVVTSFHDPADANAWQRLARGEPVSSVWRWQPGQGFAALPFGPLSGANGIAVSSDRRRIYVSAWAEGAIAVLNRDTGKVRRIEAGFLPDNLHWAPDGRLLVGGQATRVAAIAGCGAQCPQPWRIAALDPDRGTFETLVEGRGSATLNYACGAQPIGDRLWITVRGDDRIAWRRYPVRRAKP